MEKRFRSGTAGALLDLYSDAIDMLKGFLHDLPAQNYTLVLDSVTSDPDCRSVQTIVNHVVRSAYGYANLLRVEFEIPFTERKQDYGLTAADAAIRELDSAFRYTVETFSALNDESFAIPSAHIIQTAWGQSFDPDQLMEHAIMHVNRHLRQMRRLLATHP